MSKFSGGGSRLFLRAGFRPRGVIGLPGGSLMPKQGGFHETDRQSFGQKSARPGAGPLFLAVFCPELAVQPGPARSAALSLYHPLLPGLFGAGFLPAVYLPGHGHCGGQIPPGGVVHPGLGTGFRGAGVLPAQGAPVVCPVRAPGDLCGAGHHPQRVYECLSKVLLLFFPLLWGDGELCGRLIC